MKHPHLKQHRAFSQPTVEPELPMKKIMSRSFLSIAILSNIASFHVCASTEHEDPVMSQSSLVSPDPYTLVGAKNFLSGYQPINDDGSVNVVIEIPSGTNSKWEVSKSDGALKWTYKNGTPRVVNYLSYPGNYGMIPQTILPKESGGDGDPLDVLVLGPTVPRGSVIGVKIIGILHLLDDGEKDDKLIAVTRSTLLYQVNSIEELDQVYAGISAILETWFSNYKGPGKIQSLGYGNEKAATDMLDSAVAEFTHRQRE